MSKVNWAVVAVVCAIVLLVLMFGMSFMGGRGYYGGYGMMGPWMMGPWMMGGFFLMWLLPLGFVVLLVLGIALLLKGRGDTPAAPTSTCPSCGRGVQPDWKNCPYCGTSLSKPEGQ